MIAEVRNWGAARRPTERVSLLRSWLVTIGLICVRYKRSCLCGSWLSASSISETLRAMENLPCPRRRLSVHKTPPAACTEVHQIRLYSPVVPFSSSGSLSLAESPYGPLICSAPTQPPSTALQTVANGRIQPSPSASARMAASSQAMASG